MKKLGGFLTGAAIGLLWWGFLLLLPVSAQSQQTANIHYNYDVSSTSYIYCKLLGTNGNPFGAEIQGVGLAKTTGSSANIAEAVVDANPFAPLAVGDIMIFRIGGTTYKRRIITYTSDSAVVVDAAINLGTAGVPFTYWKQSCGTAATDGWIEVGGFWKLNVERVIGTINATSIQTQIECQLNGVGIQVIDTYSTTATGTYSYPIHSGVWDSCRVGVKVTGDAGIQSITTGLAYQSAEQIPVEESITKVILTESSATPVFTLSVPQTAGDNYTAGVVEWTVYATDGTNTQTRTGMTYIGAVNEAGTEGCAVGDVGTTLDNTPTGTLTCTTSCVTGLTDVVQFALNCVSDRTQTLLWAKVRPRLLR